MYRDIQRYSQGISSLHTCRKRQWGSSICLNVLGGSVGMKCLVDNRCPFINSQSSSPQHLRQRKRRTGYPYSPQSLPWSLHNANGTCVCHLSTLSNVPMFSSVPEDVPGSGSCSKHVFVCMLEASVIVVIMVCCNEGLVLRATDCAASM